MHEGTDRRRKCNFDGNFKCVGIGCEGCSLSLGFEEISIFSGLRE